MDLKKGPLCTEAEFLFLIAHDFKAVIATGLKPGTCMAHCNTFTVNLASRPLPAWVWQSQVSHAVEIGHFMPHFGAPPFQVRT